MKRLRILVRELRENLGVIARNSKSLPAASKKLDALAEGNDRLQTAVKKLERIAVNTGRPTPRPSVWLDTPPNSNAALFKALSDAALQQTVAIVQAEMAGAMLFHDTAKFHRFVLDKADAAGAHCEFGVYSGKTINQFARWRPGTIFTGFDSFEGLPEDWTGWQHFDFATGGTPPEVEENVQLEIGLFSETLPRFATVTAPVSFLHVDCDLYSSTAEIFGHLGDRLAPGCVVLFDEYFCYPGFEAHERRAFSEYLESSGRTAEWFAICGQRTACRLL